ncbi:hypothetical protein HDU98_010433 [Podochytrium sp. JEL0797]|nr:hypothetical protein HDU98_010433 [Podochytrium sp. JEL0797]
MELLFSAFLGIRSILLLLWTVRFALAVFYDVSEETEESQPLLTPTRPSSSRVHLTSLPFIYETKALMCMIVAFTLLSSLLPVLQPIPFEALESLGYLFGTWSECLSFSILLVLLMRLDPDATTSFMQRIFEFVCLSGILSASALALIAIDLAEWNKVSAVWVGLKCVILACTGLVGALVWQQKQTLDAHVVGSSAYVREELLRR